MFGFGRRIARRTSRRVARRQGRWQSGSEEGDSTASATSAEEKSSSDRLDHLERLARLKEQGVLSDEEFAAEKRRLLES